MTKLIARSLFAVALLAAAPAFAADADWIKPAEEGVKSLITSLVAIGGALIGLSLVGYGLWAAMTQRLDWSRIWIFFVAGLLVTVGPSAILWFIDLMKQS